MKQRNLLIDVLKGFTIILVVMGHASQWFSGDDRSNPFYVTIYAFHMPLFMFLSGYVCYNNRGEINLFKRFQVLVIPFFVWFFISLAFHKEIIYPNIVIEKLLILLKNPAKGMWFLWLLFWQCVLLYLALKINKQREVFVLIGLWSILIFIHRILGAPIPFYGLSDLCWYLLYFTIGYVLHKYEPIAIKVIRPAGWCSFIIFPTLLFITIDPTENLFYALRLYCLALSGTFASYVFWEWITQRNNLLKRCLVYLGGISLEIYVTHYYFRFLKQYITKYIGDNFYINVIVFTALAILGCVLTELLIRRIKPLRRILYGRF
jgi:acyltransferase 3